MPAWHSNPTHQVKFLSTEKLTVKADVQNAQGYAICTHLNEFVAKVSTLPTNVAVLLGVLCAVLGSVFSLAGLWVINQVIRKRQDAKLMTSDTVHEVVATIISRDQSKVSYWFEAVRIDGMRCRITVRDREVKDQAVWKSCVEGSQQRVSCVVHRPEYCQLTMAVLNDYNATHGGLFLLQVFIGLVLVLHGFSSAVLVMAKARGLFGFLVCFPTWLLLNGWFVSRGFPKIPDWNLDLEGVSVEELGKQKPSREVGDVSGTWLFDFKVKKFEYKFIMWSKEACTFTVQGRLEGESSWNPEYEACFISGRKMTWQDDQGRRFIADFTDLNSFEGFANAGTGKWLKFTGSRKD